MLCKEGRGAQVMAQHWPLGSATEPGKEMLNKTPLFSNRSLPPAGACGSGGHLMLCSGQRGGGTAWASGPAAQPAGTASSRTSRSNSRRPLWRAAPQAAAGRLTGLSRGAGASQHHAEGSLPPHAPQTSLKAKRKRRRSGNRICSSK